MASQDKDNAAIDPTNPLCLHPNEGPLNITEKLQGLVTKDPQDKKKKELWETCNNVVIGWLYATVNESIGKSALYYTLARNMWLQLENKGELENLNQLLVITQMNPEINALIQTLERQKEEQHLFQFLNGLDEDYVKEISQLLRQSPLPSVETACASLQQEEAQRAVLYESKSNVEASATSSKKTNTKNKKSYKQVVEEECKECGKKNHPTEKCWNIIGYPMAIPCKNNLVFKRKDNKELSNSEEEIETSFSGMVTCCNVLLNKNVWILDFGASDHKIFDQSLKINPKEIKTGTKINFPNGNTINMTHTRDVIL
ncbi:Copia protein [Bienertia sinuspersici]